MLRSGVTMFVVALVNPTSNLIWNGAVFALAMILLSIYLDINGSVVVVVVVDVLV